MEQLYLLFQKELLLWRNGYWRTRKQIALTLAVAAPVALVAVFSGRAVLRWFSPIAEEVQGGLTVNALSPLVTLLMVWLFMLFFFSAAMLSRERLLLTPDLPFLMATPVNAKIILAQRLIFLTFLSPFGLFEVAVFGLTPLAAMGLLTAAPWFYYLLLLYQSFVLYAQLATICADNFCRSAYRHAGDNSYLAVALPHGRRLAGHGDQIRRFKQVETKKHIKGLRIIISCFGFHSGLKLWLTESLDGSY
ncbi:MAG: hypothetical protein KGZ32_03615 [Dethiobacter sp.]|nr:hypothetical protein [Dethiobacter sp.]MBS3948487.1 hypothetical protein [Dethiobacter sp.]